MTPNSVIDFLNTFETVRFTTKTRFHLMHIVALPTTRDNTNEYIERILTHPMIQGNGNYG